MKKKSVALLLTVLTCASVSSLTSCGSNYDIVFFNWGEYIKEGLIDQFEAETGYKVKMENFQDNETMIQKMASTDYDVICPSDYAIEELVKEGRILKLDQSKFTNYKTSRLISGFQANLQSLATDGFPFLDYAVPYTFGEVGLLYDSSVISEDTLKAKGWDILLEQAYKIAIYDSSRDVYSVAMAANGDDFVSPSQDVIDRATAWLKKINLDKVAFITDQILESMPNHAYDVVLDYSGDAFYCMQNEVGRNDLRFYIPDAVKDVSGNTNVRTNLFTDALCITDTCKNTDAAYAFLDFLSRKDIAAANIADIAYVTPFQDVMDELIAERPENAADDDPTGAFYDIKDQYNLNPSSLDHLYRYNTDLRVKLEGLYSNLKLS